MSGLEILGWIVLFLLLLRVLSKLQDIYVLLRPDAPAPPTLLAIPGMILRKSFLVAYGAAFLVLSKDKVSKSQLLRAPDPDEIAGAVDREVRVIFIRHGESMWNLVFNRGFGPSFLVRLVKTALFELYLAPFEDSAFLDSPLSDLGLQQCSQLQEFLRHPCIDTDQRARADFAALTSGEGRSVVVSSQLRRAVATLAMALSDRLSRSKEPILLHSSCQEISRNFDTMSIAPPHGAPSLYGAPELETRISLDGAANKGNKSLGFRGAARLADFAEWAIGRQEQTVIVGGHSLWFRSFFQMYLPKLADHPAKKRKIVNCGAVGFTLQSGRAADGGARYRIDADSITVIYGGFASK